MIYSIKYVQLKKRLVPSIHELQQLIEAFYDEFIRHYRFEAEQLSISRNVSQIV